MKKFLSFGDVHLSFIRPWSKEAGDNFINWFEQQNFGPKEDIEIAFAGDITEKDVNPGDVIAQSYRLFRAASQKAKMVYVCSGNHEVKLYHQKKSSALKFLTEAFDNIKVFEQEEMFTSANGFRVLMLPYQKRDDLVFEDHYTDYIKTIEDKNFDIIMGHWNMAEPTKKGFLSFGVDVTGLKANCWALGHIHSRYRKEYIGSVFPNNSDEQYSKYPRCYKVLDEERKYSEVSLPEFLHYGEIKYGDAVPAEIPNCISVWTVLNAPTETAAYEKYPTLHIKGIGKTEGADFSQVASDDTDLSVSRSLWELFNEMIDETGIKLDRMTYGICKTLLENI